MPFTIAAILKSLSNGPKRPPIDSGLNQWRATVTKNAAWAKLEARLARYTQSFTTDWNENEVRAIAENHLEFAKALCPKKTGKLADSLHLTVDKTEFRQTTLSRMAFVDRAGDYAFSSGDRSTAGGALSVGSRFTGRSISTSESLSKGVTFTKQRYYLTADDPIAWHVEYGTSKMPAQPFMRPAYAFAKEFYLRRLRIWAIQRARAST